MAGTIHAVTLGGLLIVTAWLCVSRRSQPSRSRVMFAIAGAAVYAVLVSLTSVHACGLGNPFTQWVLPAGCLAASTMFIGTASVRRGLAFIR